MSQKYVFITAHDAHVSFRTDAHVTGSDPVIKPDTSDAVLARTVTMFENRGYEVEVRDERKVAKKVTLDYNEYGVLTFDGQDLFKAASDVAMKVLKPMTDAATPMETRLIEQEMAAAIACALGEIRIRKALAIRDAHKNKTGQDYTPGLGGHCGTAKLDGAPRRIRNPR